MTKEIILVEVVNKNDMSTSENKAFTITEKADDYFRFLVGKYGITDDGNDIEAFLEDGFCDFNDYIYGNGEMKSIITKCIAFDYDGLCETSIF